MLLITNACYEDNDRTDSDKDDDVDKKSVLHTWSSLTKTNESVASLTYSLYRH